MALGMEAASRIPKVVLTDNLLLELLSLELVGEWLVYALDPVW